MSEPRRAAPPMVSGARPGVGHTWEMLSDPVALLTRGHHEHGLVYSLRFPGRRACVLLGPTRSKLFFAETHHRLSIADAVPSLARMFGRDFYQFAPLDSYLRQRETLLPVLRSAESHVDSIDHEVSLCLDGLPGSGVFDLLDFLGPLVMKISARCFLGPSVSADIGRSMYEEMRRFSGGISPVVPWWVPTPAMVRSRLARRRLRTWFHDVATLPVDMTMLLVWAGQEATTGQLAWSLIDLLRHPAERDRVRKSAEHLDRALTESQRLHPVAFAMGRKASAPLEVDGYTIPKGSLVLTTPAVSHRIPEDFPRPETFWPDRFVKHPDSRGKLITFGGGLHRCLGVQFARTVMTVVVDRMLRGMDLELLTSDPQPVLGPTTRWPRQPCLVRFRKLTT